MRLSPLSRAPQVSPRTSLTGMAAPHPKPTTAERKEIQVLNDSDANHADSLGRILKELMELNERKTAQELKKESLEIVQKEILRFSQ